MGGPLSAFLSRPVQDAMAPAPTKARLPSIPRVDKDAKQPEESGLCFLSVFHKHISDPPFLTSRGMSSSKMHWIPHPCLNLCILDVDYLSIHNIFIWSKRLPLQRLCFLVVAVLDALTRMNTLKRCSTCLQKSPFAHQKQFPLWYDAMFMPAAFTKR